MAWSALQALHSSMADGCPVIILLCLLQGLVSFGLLFDGFSGLMGFCSSTDSYVFTQVVHTSDMAGH